MSLDAELGIDLSQVNFSEAEHAVASGVLVPEGYHHAVLESVRGGVSSNKGTPFREFTFKILAGPAKDATVEHTLYLPHAGQDEDKKKKSTNQFAIYCHRLGLKKKVDAGGGKTNLVPIDGKHDFTDCLGAVCVIEVKHEEEEFVYKNGPKAGKPGKITKAKLSWEGVLSVDDPRCKDVPKGKFSGSLPAPKPVAKDTYDDI